MLMVFFAFLIFMEVEKGTAKDRESKATKKLPVRPSTFKINSISSGITIG